MKMHRRSKKPSKSFIAPTFNMKKRNAKMNLCSLWSD